MKLGFTRFLSVDDTMLDFSGIWNPTFAFAVPFNPTYGTKWYLW